MPPKPAANSVIPTALLLATLLWWPHPSALGQHDPLFVGTRSTIVQLFEWTFADIARECEQFLGPYGYGAVQISAVTENLIVPGRPWYERYQPISYRIDTRSGDRAQLLDMTTRCNRAGIRVYIDVVLNHMAGGDAPRMIGTGGSTATFANRSYPNVPYEGHEFHRPCAIVDHNDAHMVRNCDLNGLPDLDQSLESVRGKMVAFLDELVSLGVAGFRMGGAKHMWPNDLKTIYKRVRNLSVEHGFAVGTRAFIVQEVNDNGLEPISKTEYTFVGTVAEIRYSTLLAQTFSGTLPMTTLHRIGPADGYIHSSDAVVYVDDHDSQRQSSNHTLSYRKPAIYQAAVAFMLAHDYGVARLMSSFTYSEFGDGPPVVNGTERIRSPFAETSDGDANEWVAEHRWPIIAQMVGWRNAVGDRPVIRWHAFGFQQVAFCRGRRGFVAFNGDDDRDLDARMYVCVPPGRYCNVIRRTLDGECGEYVQVDENRMADVLIVGNETVRVLAIHVE